jgi:hypothetical protein
MASDRQAGKYVSGCPIRNYAESQTHERKNCPLLEEEKGGTTANSVDSDAIDEICQLFF